MNEQTNAANKNPLDLNNLTMDNIDFSILPEISAKIEQEEQKYKEKYGDNWWEHYIQETNPYYEVDSIEEAINEAIYHGHRLCISAHPTVLMEMEKRYWEKMKRLFGPFCKRYVNHAIDDPKVNKALIKDALKSGKWKELPKELQGEYHKTASKKNG